MSVCSSGAIFPQEYHIGLLRWRNLLDGTGALYWSVQVVPSSRRNTKWVSSGGAAFRKRSTLVYSGGRSLPQEDDIGGQGTTVLEHYISSYLV